MKRIFEFIGGFALIAFSFYFTDRVSLLVASKSELMQEIKSVSATYETSPVDAMIDTKNNTIIPGKYGRTVNSQESYLEMHDFGSFNENYLVFDYIKPQKSVLDNKDLFITGGNPSYRRISLILESNESIEEYLNKTNVSYNKIILEEEKLPKNVEAINGANLKEDFNKIDSTLRNSTKLCIKTQNNINLCKKKSYFLIEPKLTLESANLIEIKNNISSGSIILITSKAKLEDLKLLLQEAEYKDLEIVKLSILISEKESY